MYEVQRAVKYVLSFLCIVSVFCYEVWAHDLFFETRFSFTEIKSTLRWAETVRNSLYVWTVRMWPRRYGSLQGPSKWG